jgi:hypothetical protein
MITVLVRVTPLTPSLRTRMKIFIADASDALGFQVFMRFNKDVRYRLWLHTRCRWLWLS